VTSGYSGTPLAQKLGLKDGDVVTIVNEPDGFRSLLDVGNDEVTFKQSLRAPLDMVIVFLVAAAEMRKRRDLIATAIFPDGAIWVAWPKKASKVPTDITEGTVREVFLPHGLVDNKVCAIDETWSGLRVVWRQERRQR